MQDKRQGCVYVYTYACAHAHTENDRERERNTQGQKDTERQRQDREAETERGCELSINTKINLQTNFKKTQGHIPGLHFRATMMVQHMQNRIYKDTRMLFRTHDHPDVYRKSHQQPIMKKALKK